MQLSSSPPSSRSPHRKLFNRSMSTDCPSTTTTNNNNNSTTKQSWNRRSMRYCRSKSKHLYHMVVCRFLVVGGYSQIYDIFFNVCLSLKERER